MSSRVVVRYGERTMGSALRSVLLAEQCGWEQRAIARRRLPWTVERIGKTQDSHDSKDVRRTYTKSHYAVQKCNTCNTHDIQ